MGKLIYYVAISLDGFICGENDDISGFISDGEGVKKYLQDLQLYETVIKGRKTYEFGYQFGMKPGQLPYPHMQHYIVSATLNLPETDENLLIIKPDIEEVEKIKNNATSDVYLCGGGELAGWMLKNKLVDVVKIKLNPFIQGSGTRLFEKINDQYQLVMFDSQKFPSGLHIISYLVKY